MADWYTPTQVQKALEITWMKLENTTNIPLGVPIFYNSIFYNTTYLSLYIYYLSPKYL